jgi:hypothetical protein
MRASMSVVVEPATDLVRVETHEVTDLHVGNTVLVDEATKVADAVAEPGGELFSRGDSPGQVVQVFIGSSGGGS